MRNFETRQLAGCYIVDGLSPTRFCRFSVGTTNGAFASSTGAMRGLESILELLERRIVR
jgi:hypothetical protein